MYTTGILLVKISKHLYKSSKYNLKERFIPKYQRFEASPFVKIPGILVS